MEYATRLFSALSESLRLRCLALMAREGELCVCELTHALQAGQPQISKHLATLRDCGLVKDRRDAQWVFYSIANDIQPWCKDAVAAAVQAVSAEALHAGDTNRLRTMQVRPPRRRAA
jgi:ArsR family transcriptional regulator